MTVWCTHEAPNEVEHATCEKEQDRRWDRRDRKKLWMVDSISEGKGERREVMFGMPVHHIGIACDDIEKTSKFIRSYFSTVSESETIFDKNQQAFVRLLHTANSGVIELISGPAVRGILAKGMTIYHICYVAKSVEDALLQAQKAGAVIVSRPKPAILFGSRLIAFISTPVGLIEFLEEEKG